MDWNQKSQFKHQIFHGTMARRVLLRSFLIAAAFSVIPLFLILTGPYLKMLAPLGSGGCSVHLSRNFTASWYVFQGRHLNPIWSSIEPTRCRELADSTEAIVRDLVSMNLLNPIGAKALCLGEGSELAAETLRESLGFSSSEALGRTFRNHHRHEDASFDFVLSRDPDPASVGEIERVLVPGGIGAVVSGPATSALRLKHSRLVFERVAVVAFEKGRAFPRPNNRASLGPKKAGPRRYRAGKAIESEELGSRKKVPEIRGSISRW